MGTEFKEIMALVEQRIKDRMAEPEKSKVELTGKRRRK
jgi:hypothetical protein